jgi:hypothetical protein
VQGSGIFAVCSAAGTLEQKRNIAKAGFNQRQFAQAINALPEEAD